MRSKMIKKIFLYTSLFFISAESTLCVAVDKNKDELPVSSGVRKLSQVQEQQVTAAFQNLSSSPQKILWLTGANSSSQTATSSPSSSPINNEEKKKKRHATTFSKSPVPSSIPDTSALTRELQSRKEENTTTKKDSIDN